MGAQRDELATELCLKGRLECVDRYALMEALRGLVEMSRDEHQLLAEQGPAMLNMGARSRRVFAALLESVVLQYAMKGDVVLVGRGANILLRMVPGVLRVRTVAPLELRAVRLANLEGLDLDGARQLASAVDQQRRAYVAHVFGMDWSSPLSYDLVLNMGRISLEQAATTVLDLAAHSDFQTSSETRRHLGELVLAARVRRAVVEEVDVHELSVECDEGVCELCGHVGSQEDLDRVVALVELVEGMREFKCNLEVSPVLMKFLP